MRFNLALISFLFASTILADYTLGHRSHLLEDIELAVAPDAPKHIMFTYRAGAIVKLDGGSVKNASASFTVPTMKDIPDATVLIAVEIDDQDAPCGNTLVAGVLISVSSTGPTYTGCYRTSNTGNIHLTSNFPISPGHLINAAVRLSNATSGEVIITNLSENRTQQFSVTTNEPLCMQNAQWIVRAFEKYTLPSSYGAVIFDFPMVYDVEDKSYMPPDAVIMNMMDPYGVPLTNITFDDITLMITPLK